MKQIIEKALHEAGDPSAIQSMKRVHGGSINESYQIITAEHKYFLKYHADAPEHFFRAEAEGLKQIEKTNTIAVPKVLAYSDEKNASFLLMEWVEGRKKANTDQMLGTHLAQLHQNVNEKHGYAAPTYIGILPQPNGLYSTWLTYYRKRRLGSQLELGKERNTITGKRRELLEKLLDHLERWIPKDVEASYLHGDLWGGNWLVGPDGEPYLIDPSFLYGDRHFEMAFTELFGGFSSEFYHFYNDQFPLDSDYNDKKQLYQLYYLLVHLNMFGEAYGSGVDRILKRYAGK